MPNSNQHKDPKQHENIKRRHLAFRLNVFFFATFFLFSVLIIRLAYLQFVEGQYLKAQEATSIVKEYEFPPIRGGIYDRNGYPLADTTSTESLFFRIETNMSNESMVETAIRLSKVFEDFGEEKLSPEEVLKRMEVDLDIDGNRLHGNVPAYHVPRRVKTDLTKEEIAYVLEHRDEFRGVEIIEESIRNYSHYQDQFIASQLIGYLRPYSVAKGDARQSPLSFYQNPDKVSSYIDTEYVGYDGIEFMYQEELRGSNGIRSYTVNAIGKIIDEKDVIPPTKGNNLYLTIDKDVQIKAQQAIVEHLEYMKSDEAKRLKYPAMGSKAEAGYAVAMEVKTGNVVAMASMPDYDANVWRGGLSAEDWERIQHLYTNGTIRQRAPNLPADQLASHPTSLVPLGSTIKPLTVLLGLQEGLITANEPYNDTGVFYFGRDRVPLYNSERKALGRLNAASAIIKSSNTYMAELIGGRLFRSRKDPLDLWHSYMEQFGLGVSTESGLPSESRGVIEYFKEAEASGSSQSPLIYASFGQQGRYTALQLAQYTVTLANRGKRIQPQFVERITTFDGSTVKTFDPVILNEVEVEDRHWDVVLKAMEGVGKQGFNGFPYTVASKTGTSQQQVRGGIVNNAVFIAYAPAEDPVLAVAVVVPEGGFGSWGAAPIARMIFDAYDEHIGLTGTPKPRTAPPVLDELELPEGEEATVE